MKELIQLQSFPVRTTLNILLRDKTTKKNIIWATSSYKEYGEQYADISLKILIIIIKFLLLMKMVLNVRGMLLKETLKLFKRKVKKMMMKIRNKSLYYQIILNDIKMIIINFTNTLDNTSLRLKE